MYPAEVIGREDTLASGREVVVAGLKKMSEPEEVERSGAGERGGMDSEDV